MEKPEPANSRIDQAFFNTKTQDVYEEFPEIRLSEGIDISQLESGDTFEIADQVLDQEYTPQRYYKPEDLYNHLDLDTVDHGDETDDSTPFEKLARGMKPIIEDKGILKKIVKQGVGEKVPEAAYVTVHYNAYVEYEDAPYDSSRIKDRPFRFRLGRESDDFKNVLWGVDVAVASMHMKERSKFLISPGYAYGKLGCPPRIPPEATLLYDIELLNFSDTMGLDEYYSLTAAERKEAPFELVRKVVEKERKEGNDAFAVGNRHSAISKYKRAIQRLQECRLQNDEEETVQQKLLLRTSLNIALCYMKEKMPKKCLLATNDAISIDRNNAKAFYLRGKALIQLAEFDRAKYALNRAKECKPRDKDILAAFRELEAKYAKFNRDERRLCQAMLGLKIDEVCVKRDKSEAYSDEFKNIMKSQIAEFVEDDEMSELPLRMSNLTAGEIRCIKDVAKEFNLEVAVVGRDGNSHYRIRKPPVLLPGS